MFEKRQLKGRQLNLSERLVGVDRPHGLSQAFGVWIVVLAPILSFFVPFVERHLTKFALLGLGMLLFTLVDRVTVIAHDVAGVSDLVWDVITDNDSERKEWSVATRVRLRGFLGLDPER